MSRIWHVLRNVRVNVAQPQNLHPEPKLRNSTQSKVLCLGFRGVRVQSLGIWG